MPHFEKMLYDNAQLARVYLHAWQLTGEPRYREVVEETLDFVARELRTPTAASRRAWTPTPTARRARRTSGTRLRSIGPRHWDAALFCAAYGVREGGNWEGQTILSARPDGPSGGETRSGWGPGRERLARASCSTRGVARPQPGRDDKVLAAWNGLMLAAFAEAARGLRGPS